ncbi:hypothetical protein M3187_23395, partial [Mesobacillus subterraneus]
MRKYFTITLSFLLLVSLVFVKRTYAMEDLEGPELVKVDINKSSINASEEITVFIDPKEDISGVQYAGIVVKSPSGNQSFGKNIWSPDAEGRYTYTISIGENAEAGKWGVDS